MANRNIPMADGTPPGSGPDRGEAPRNIYDQLRSDPYVQSLINKPQSELTVGEEIELASRGFRPFPGASIGRPNVWGAPNNERGEPQLRPTERQANPTGIPELPGDEREEGIRAIMGDQAMAAMTDSYARQSQRSEEADDSVDPRSGLNDRSLEQMRYQSPVFNDFANILSRHQNIKAMESGVSQLNAQQSREALLDGMKEIRTRVLRIMVDQFRDDSTQEMPPQVGEMIQAINLLLARHQLVDARLEREKVNHLIQGMQLVQYSSAMAKYSRAKWYEAPANFYKHHFTTLFKIPAVLEASRVIARADKNGALGVTFMKPQFDEEEEKNYLAHLRTIDSGVTKDGVKNFDMVTGYKIIEEVWKDKDYAHIQGFDELFYNEHKVRTDARLTLVSTANQAECTRLAATDQEAADNYLNTALLNRAREYAATAPLADQIMQNYEQLRAQNPEQAEQYLQQERARIQAQAFQRLNAQVERQVNAGRIEAKKEFRQIQESIQDTGKSAGELNENQKKLRALFVKAMEIVHPNVGEDQYDKPIFADVAARLIFEDGKEEGKPNKYESLLNYTINGKNYRINREAFVEITNQLQLALNVSHRISDTLGISTQFDGFAWRKDKELPDEIKNYCHFDKAGDRPADYGINTKGGVVLLNPVMTYKFKDPGNNNKEVECQINLRLAAELAVRKGGYDKLNEWEKLQVRALKVLTRDNTAGVIACWSNAYRELFLKYGDEYIDWSRSARNRGPRDATKHMKNTGDMMSPEEMNPGQFEKLRMLGYYNQISILQAFSAGSVEDYVFGGIVKRGDDPFGSDAEAFKKTASVPAQGDFNTWFNRYKYIYARWKGSEDVRKIIEGVVYSAGPWITGETMVDTLKKLKEKADFLTKRQQTDTETPEIKQYIYDVGRKLLEFRTQHSEEQGIKNLNARAVDQVINVMDAESLISSSQMDDLTKEYLGNRIQKEWSVLWASLDRKAAKYEFLEQFFKAAGGAFETGLKAA